MRCGFHVHSKLPKLQIGMCSKGFMKHGLIQLWLWNQIFKHLFFIMQRGPQNAACILHLCAALTSSCEAHKNEPLAVSIIAYCCEFSSKSLWKTVTSNQRVNISSCA